MPTIEEKRLAAKRKLAREKLIAEQTQSSVMRPDERNRPGDEQFDIVEDDFGIRYARQDGELVPLSVARIQADKASGEITGDTQSFNDGRNAFLSSLMSRSGNTFNERTGNYQPLPNRNTQERVASALNGPTLNYGSEIAGVLGGVGAAATGGDFSEGFTNTYNNFERDLQNNRRERPVEAFLTEVVTGGATGSGVGKTLELANRGRAVGVGITGATTGLIAGSGEDGDALQRGTNAALGGTFGAVLGKAMQAGLSRFGQRGARQAQQQIVQDADDFGIPLSRGQASDDFATRQFERGLQRGQGQNDRAQELARGFYNEQRDATIDAARNRFAQGPATAGRQAVNEAGEITGGALRSAADDLGRATNEAYDAARQYGAQIQQEGMRGITTAIAQAVDDDVAISLNSGVRQGLEGTRQALGLVQNALPREGNVDFRQIEAVRRSLGNMARDAAKNPERATDARQIFKMRAALDGALDEAVDQALFNGDEAFLSAYRNARGLRAQYAQQFEGKDAAGRIINKIISEDADAVKTINYIFGVSDNFSVSRTREVLGQIKTTLGADSDAFQSLRQAAIEKMLGRATNAQTSRGDLPAVMLTRGIDEALDGRGQEIFRVLFSADELADLRRYQTVVQRMIEPAGAVNYSGTATGLIRGQDFFTGRMRELFNRVDRFIGGTPVSGEYARAARSFNRPNAFVASQAAPAASVAGGQVGGQLARTTNPFLSAHQHSTGR